MPKGKIPLISDYPNVGIMFRKELRSYFNSAIAYVLIIVFLCLLGWFYVNNIFLYNVSSMRSMFDIIPIIFLFFVPALTMRLISEEKKSGTIELLTTKPINDIEIVLGKFFAAWALIALALLPTLLYYISVASVGKIDNGPIIGGYIGLLLMAGVYISIGLFASCLTENQIIAFIMGFVFVLVLFFLDKILLYLPDWMASSVEYFGIDYHFSNIARGVVDSRDIIYFLSVIIFSLMLSVRWLNRRKWN